MGCVMECAVCLSESHDFVFRFGQFVDNKLASVLTS
jgi:hypothetical protein